MSWLSWDDDDDVADDDSDDDEDMVPTDQVSDLFDATEGELGDAWSEEELDDEYDPTEIEDYG